MELSKSQKIVKVLGIISIIAAVLNLIGAIGIIGLTVGIVPQMEEADVAKSMTALIAGGIVMIVTGVVDLLEGIFSLRAAKDAAKVMPLWVISIIGVVMSVISFVLNLGEGSQTILSGIFSIAISVFIFWLANNIKKQAQ